MRSAFPVESFNADVELEAISPSIAGQGKGADTTTSFIVRGTALPAAPALSVKNFRDPTVPRMRYGQRAPGRSVTELVVHDTVSTSLAGTIKTFLATPQPGEEKRSVHLIVAPDGGITQHGDLGDEVLWHAKPHNFASVGVEVVNPYYPSLLKPGMPWNKTIKAGWAHKGQYVVPTLAQSEVLARLAAWITSPSAKGLSIPRKWAGVSNGKLAMNRAPGGDKRAPGIYAHTYFPPHADGAWLVLYAWLRLEGGQTPEEAYDEAMRLGATPHNWVTLPAKRLASSPPVGREVFESASYEFPWIG